MSKAISDRKNGISDQLTKLRKLTQPYFLPYTSNNGWLFILLLVSLLFCVAGLVLCLLSLLMHFAASWFPGTTSAYLGGVNS